MNNQNETIGLRVLSVSPSHLESNVNVNSTIDVTFTSDIDPSTLSKNIVVFEDYNKIYTNVNSLKDYSKYSVVKGSISYADKVLTYTPDKPFNVNSSYIIVLNDKITDIIGNTLTQKYISVFYTEKIASYPRCEITSPKYGYITSEIPTFKWKNQHSPSYVFQISKNNSFELLLLDEVIPGNEYEEEISYTPVFNAKEGMYFIRVKSENGEWSDTHQIFIKPIIDAVVAKEDTPEMIAYDKFFEGLTDPVEILEYFPAPNSVNNSLKTNIIYIKIKGKLDESRVNLNDSYIYGESLDEEHEEYSHEPINGSWSIVYDSYYDVTYIIFTPDLLNSQEEQEETENPDSENTNENENNESGENAGENAGENTGENTETGENTGEETGENSETGENTGENENGNENDNENTGDNTNNNESENIDDTNTNSEENQNENNNEQTNTNDDTTTELDNENGSTEQEGNNNSENNTSTDENSEDNNEQTQQESNENEPNTNPTEESTESITNPTDNTETESNNNETIDQETSISTDNTNDIDINDTENNIETP